jgi:hypothetical protein
MEVLLPCMYLYGIHVFGSDAPFYVLGAKLVACVHPEEGCECYGYRPTSPTFESAPVMPSPRYVSCIRELALDPQRKYPRPRVIMERPCAARWDAVSARATSTCSCVFSLVFGCKPVFLCIHRTSSPQYTKGNVWSYVKPILRVETSNSRGGSSVRQTGNQVKTNFFTYRWVCGNG